MDTMQSLIDELIARQIKVVAFDMDQTAVNAHSRGRLERGGATEAYLEKATPDFLKLVPSLFAAGFGLAIATHSDEAEFGGDVKPETHILGKELASALVNHHFPGQVSDSFFIVAYNPRVRGTKYDEELKIKRHHMRLIQRHFEVLPSEILFFDDIEHVVNDCRLSCGVHSVQVDENEGFVIEDLKRALTAMDDGMNK